MSFGNRIKKLRIEKHLSQAALALELGISPNTVSQYETDKRFPDKNGLVNICKFFNISSDYLLGLSNIKKTSMALFKLSENFNSCNDMQIAAINDLINAFDK